MNVREVYVLNRALDGEDIQFMPTYKSLGISELMVNAIKDGLIERGLLKSYDEFTEVGIRITNRIRRYKEAKKHVKIDNLLIGIESETESIIIIWNPLFEEYAINVIDSAMSAEQVAETYEFLNEEAVETNKGNEKLDYFEFLKKINPDSQSSFRLSTSFMGVKSEEIYCKANGELFIYDCIANTLCAKSKKDILACLKERMNVS
jgi:hypothetical protein